MSVPKGYREAFLSLPSEIREAECEAESEKNIYVQLSGGAAAGSGASDTTALFVRATGERTGFAYTENLEEEPMAVLRRACENSLYSNREKPEKMAEPAWGGAERGTLWEEPRLAEGPELLKKAKELDEWICGHAPGLVSRSVMLTERLRTVHVVNSRGADRFFAAKTVSLDLALVDEQGDYLERELSFRSLSELSGDVCAGLLGEWRLTKLPPAACSSGSFSCVLSGQVMTNIFLTAWRMFSGVSYLTGGTPYAGKMGERIGSDVLNLTDSPDLAGSGYSFLMDCEGTAGKKVSIVENGILTGRMHSLETAERLGETPTGNAGRKAMIGGNIPTEVTVIPKNFGIAPGGDSLFGMFEKMGDGLYIYDSLDVFHSVNTASGDFAIPCCALLIKGGRPVGRADGLTMNGRVQDLLAGITAVGADVTVQPMLMLHSFTVSSPAVLVRELSIVG